MWITPFAAALLAVPVAFDRERLPAPHVVASEMGGVFLRFDLPANEPSNESRCNVTALKAGFDGKDEVLWTSEGWYANQCWLTGDGRYVARMGPWARGAGPE